MANPILIKLAVKGAIQFATNEDTRTNTLIVILLPIIVIILCLFYLAPISEEDIAQEYKIVGDLISGNWHHIMLRDMILNDNDFTDADANKSSIDFIVATVVTYRMRKSADGERDYVEDKRYTLIGKEVFKLTGQSNNIVDIVDELKRLDSREDFDIFISCLDITDFYPTFTKEQQERLTEALSQNLMASLYGEIYTYPGQVIDTGFGTAFFTNPVPSCDHMGDPYGWRMHPIYKVRKMHTGIDISRSDGKSLGQPIIAAADGYVSDIAYSVAKKGYGNQVKITHIDANNRKWVTRYAHMQAIYVKKGVKLSKGTVIGTVGSTGGSTGPHLHFEVIYENNYVDPKLYVNFIRPNNNLRGGKE